MTVVHNDMHSQSCKRVGSTRWSDWVGSGHDIYNVGGLGQVQFDKQLFFLFLHCLSHLGYSVSCVGVCALACNE